MSSRKTAFLLCALYPNNHVAGRNMFTPRATSVASFANYDSPVRGQHLCSQLSHWCGASFTRRQREACCSRECFQIDMLLLTRNKQEFNELDYSVTSNLVSCVVSKVPCFASLSQCSVISWDIGMARNPLLNISMSSNYNPASDVCM